MKPGAGKEGFNLRKRVGSTNHAARGIRLFIRNTHNAWMHIFFALVALYLGWTLCISAIEWALIVFGIGLVIVAEAFNSAIEVHMDLTSPGEHPHARDTKDIAAGAVLLAVVFVGIIGCIVFIPKLVPFLG